MRGNPINHGVNREHLDFYPTPKECTIALIKFFETKKIEFYSVVEPASGDGAISKIFEDDFYTVYSSDLRSENVYGSPNIDFLNSEIVEADALITNPPFNIADQFIEKAVQNYNIVALLLKSQYWHAASRSILFENQPPAYILPLTWRPDFLETVRTADKKVGSTMDVCWNVWLNGDIQTKYELLKKPTSYNKVR